MFPSEKLLPPATILEKIKALDASSGDDIINRVEVVAERRRDREVKEQQSLRHRAKPFLQGMAMAFVPFATPRRSAFETATMNSNFASVGNDMRLAIRNYLAEHGEVASKLVLTEEERASLELLDVPGYSPPPKQNAHLFALHRT